MKNSFSAIALGLALIAAAAMLDYHLTLYVPSVLAVRAGRGLGNGFSFGGDFFPIWLTIRQSQAGQRDLYHAEMTREIQTGLFGRPIDPRNPTDPPTDYRTFSYPAFTDLLLWPTAEIEFPLLRRLLLPVLVVATVFSFAFWIRALDWPVHPLWFCVTTLLAVCNFPVLEALFALQPGLIAGFLLAASMLCLRRERLTLAGILLALTTIKPQMTALAILYLLLWSCREWRRRRQFLVAFIATLAALVVASLLIWRTWIRSWTSVIIGYRRYATPSLISELLDSRRAGIFGPLLIVTFLVVAAAVAWRNRAASVESPRFWLTLNLMLAITAVAILPGPAVYDDVILFPGIMLLLRDQRELRSASRVLWTVGAIVLFWPWIAAFGLVAARLFMNPEFFSSTTVLDLPIRTAVPFPFVVLALLAFTARIRLRGQEVS